MIIYLKESNPIKVLNIFNILEEDKILDIVVKGTSIPIEKAETLDKVFIMYESFFHTIQLCSSIGTEYIQPNIKNEKKVSDSCEEEKFLNIIYSGKFKPITKP